MCRTTPGAASGLLATRIRSVEDVLHDVTDCGGGIGLILVVQGAPIVTTSATTATGVTTTAPIAALAKLPSALSMAQSQLLDEPLSDEPPQSLELLELPELELELLPLSQLLLELPELKDERSVS